MTVGERIRAARKAKGLTQKQLGEACGIAEPTIRRYELGKLNPKYETLEKIAIPLGVSVANLKGVSPLPEDYLLYLEEKYIRSEIRDPEEKEAFLTHLEKTKQKGLTFQQRQALSDAGSEVYDLINKLGYSDFSDEECPLPDNYDSEEFFVSKDERTGNFFIVARHSFDAMINQIQDYALQKLQDLYSCSIPFQPDTPPSRQPADFWEHPEKYIKSQSGQDTQKQGGKKN